MYKFEDMNFGYSEEGLIGRIELLRDFVDVEFYFEDERNEPFYEVWLNALFPDLVTEHVFCLGGKGPVLAEANKKNCSGRARIFILDKDFDDLLIKPISIEGVIRLNAYSIENYFLSREAISKVALGKFSGLRMHKIHAELQNIETAFENILSRYSTMAKLFYLVRKFGLKNIQTSKKKVNELIIDKTVEGILPASIIDDYVAVITTEAKKQNNRLQDSKLIESELALDFEPKKGCIQIGDHRLYPNFPGKHLFKMLCILFDRVCTTKFEDLPSQIILISLVQTTPGLPELFEPVKSAILQSIERQHNLGNSDLSIAA